MGRKPKFSNQQIINALKDNDGFVTYAAKSLGCDYHTVNNYIKHNPDIRMVIDEINEHVLDICENRLRVAIANNDLEIIKWFLSKKGHKRGFGNKPDEIENDKIEVIIRRASEIGIKDRNKDK